MDVHKGTPSRLCCGSATAVSGRDHALYSKTLDGTLCPKQAAALRARRGTLLGPGAACSKQGSWLGQCPDSVLIWRARRGTLPYMAPELVSDPDHVSEKADVWSLGMVLWEMLAQRTPFQHLAPQQIIAGAQLTHLLPSHLHAAQHVHTFRTCKARSQRDVCKRSPCQALSMLRDPGIASRSCLCEVTVSVQSASVSWLDCWNVWEDVPHVFTGTGPAHLCAK